MASEGRWDHVKKGRTPSALSEESLRFPCSQSKHNQRFKGSGGSTIRPQDAVFWILGLWILGTKEWHIRSPHRCWGCAWCGWTRRSSQSAEDDLAFMGARGLPGSWRERRIAAPLHQIKQRRGSPCTGQEARAWRLLCSALVSKLI